MPVQLLDQLRHKHGILAAGDADRDPVSFINKFIALDRRDKRRPELFPVFLDDASLRDLMRRKFSSHRTSFLTVAASFRCSLDF